VEKLHIQADNLVHLHLAQEVLSKVAHACLVSFCMRRYNCFDIAKRQKIYFGSDVLVELGIFVVSSSNVEIVRAVDKA
jgi:hypothetical protein